MAEFVMRFEVAIIFVLFILIGVGAGAGAGGEDDDASSSAALKLNFYNETTCPQAESIIQELVEKLIQENASFAPALLRMQFHDCFIRGCDASVLLDTSPSSPNGTETEKNSPANKSLRGFEFIENVKKALEDLEECRGVVSCADIIALVSRDAVVAINGSYWEVPTGRRDGNDSSELDVRTDLPFPTDNLTTLVAKFNKKGLSYRDLVLLSGAHTIGNSSCTSFTNRLYNFSGTGKPDPTLDSDYEKKLQRMCPAINTNFKVEMDPNSSMKFDQSYYRKLLDNRGLFSSDATLLTNSTTKDLVIKLEANDHKYFFQQFAASMVKMSNIGVLTGTKG